MDPAIEAECARLSAIERLDEITGVGEHNAQVIIAEPLVATLVWEAANWG